ncbi:MAG: hypothetical protein ACC645_22410 [Pirellulales bacterium]
MTTPLVQWLPEKREFQDALAARRPDRKRPLRAWPWLLYAMLVIGTTGCAQAYRDYPCGDVPYAYCPAPPLPYDTYDACPTPVAKCYLASEQSDQTLDDLPIEADDAGQRGS